MKAFGVFVLSLFAIFSSCTADVFSGQLKQYIVDRHNSDRRTKIKSSASNMRELTWSDELAQIASEHSTICVFQHSTDNKLGENIASFSAGSNDKTTIDLFMKWWVDDELVGISGNGVGVYNHASQVLWAESSKIGCGFTKCGGELGIFVVCNFDPRGNTHVNGWYLEGPACSKCPSDAPKCNNKLCSTGSGPNPRTKAPVVTTKPTRAPVATTKPTEAPAYTVNPTEAPIATTKPTEAPVYTVKPTEAPIATANPTEAPVYTVSPTEDPVLTTSPSVEPTISPTSGPATQSPTYKPSTGSPKPRPSCN